MENKKKGEWNGGWGWDRWGNGTYQTGDYDGWVVLCYAGTELVDGRHDGEAAEGADESPRRLYDVADWRCGLVPVPQKARDGLR